MKTVLISFIYLAVSLLILIFARFIFKKFVKYDLTEEAKSCNATAIVPYGGFLFGMVFILAAAYSGNSVNAFYIDLLTYIGYSILGLCLMIFSGWIVEKTVLYKFNNVDEIVRDRNMGTAAVHFGIYVASGLIISACIAGDNQSVNNLKYYGFISTIVYYCLGILFLTFFTKLYDIMTPFSLLEEIEKDNVAVGVAFGGNIIAIGIILMKATLGDVGTWQHGLLLYFIDLSAIILILPCVRYVLDKFIVQSIKIGEEIKNNNIAAGFTEAFAIICFALLIFFIIDFVNMV